MHSFKWLKPALFLVLCALLTSFLNFALMPPNTVRINLHNIRDGQEKPYDTIFLGTSHGQYGINPEVVDTGGSHSISLCMADEYLIDSYYLLKLAIEVQKQKPSVLVYELDPSYWMTEQRNGSTQIFFYQEFPFSLAKAAYFFDKVKALDFRSTLAPWSYYRNLYRDIPDNIQVKLSGAYQNFYSSILNIPMGHYGGRGFIYRNHVDGENKGTFNNIPWDESQVKPQAIRYFDKIAKFCQKEDIQLVVMTTPIPQDTLNQYPDSYEQSDAFFTELLEKYGLEYYNFNHVNPGLLDRSMNGYWDYDGHMDGVLADDFSNLFGQFLLDLQENTYLPSEYFTK